MATYNEKGEQKNVPGTVWCCICGGQAVIKQSDGRMYCYDHHIEYCRGKSYEQIKSGDA
jgi:hypothetical protein